MIDPTQDPVWRSFVLYVLIGAACVIVQQELLTPFLPWLVMQPLVALTVHAGFRRGPREAAWIATALGIVWDVTGSGLFGACWFRLMMTLGLVLFVRRILRDSVPFLLFSAVLATLFDRILYTVEYAGFAGWKIPATDSLSALPLAITVNTLLAWTFVLLFDWIFRTRFFRLLRSGIDVTGGSYADGR